MSLDETCSVSSGVSESGLDEKAKKKMQNSARWKRWWSKNREAYNEKRRLSAQQKSAKTRAERHKRQPKDNSSNNHTDEDEDDSVSVTYRQQSNKRARRLGREESGDDATSAGSGAGFEDTAATPPAVSPKIGFHDIMSPNLFALSRSLQMAAATPHMVPQPMLPNLAQFKTLPALFGLPHHQQAPRSIPTPNFLFPAGALQSAMQQPSSHQAPMMHNMFYPSAAGQMMPGLPYRGFRA